MPKQFDATLKDLAESYPSDWLTQLELPATGLVALVDADVSTVTAQADKVLGIGGPNPWLLHMELQASRDPELATRLLRYNVLLYGRHALPVHTAVVLLRPESGRPWPDRRRELPIAARARRVRVSLPSSASLATARGNVSVGRPGNNSARTFERRHPGRVAKRDTPDGRAFEPGGATGRRREIMGRDVRSDGATIFGRVYGPIVSRSAYDGRIYNLPGDYRQGAG